MDSLSLNVGSKAYNGSLVSVVFDITKDPERFVLHNGGNKWFFRGKGELKRYLPDLLNEAEEEDVYLNWYNCELI